MRWGYTHIDVKVIEKVSLYSKKRKKKEV